jgi:two-component system, response regulator PdtaR
LIEQASGTGRPVALVVEDEILIRLNAADLFEDLGFEAIEAANADEALAVLESRADVRLLFTDIDMPGSMDGLRLAHAVADRWPPIALIVTSGHVRVRAHEVPEGGLFVGKPYGGAQIKAALERLRLAG